MKAEIAALKKRDLELDEHIKLLQSMNTKLAAGNDDSSNSVSGTNNVFVTYDDIRELKVLQEKVTLAIKASKETFLEVPDPDEGLEDGVRRYEIMLTSISDPIDVFLINKEGTTGGHDSTVRPSSLAITLPYNDGVTDNNSLKSPTNFHGGGGSPQWQEASPLRPHDYTALNELFTDAI